MKFVIVGAGATGSCIGGYLARMGRNVTFIARGENLRVLRDKGLTIQRGENEDIVIPNVNACTQDEYQKVPDVIFVCVKYYSLDNILPFLQRVATPSTLVIPILNVFGTGEVLQEQLPDVTCLDGCIYIWASRTAPGVVSQPEKILKVVFGFRPGEDNRLYSKAQVVEQSLRAAGIHAQLSDDIRRDALMKFSFVSPMGAAGLYLNAVSGDMQPGGRARETFLALAREVQKLGQAMGIVFEHDPIEQDEQIMDKSAPNLTTSMQRDVAKGGPSEFAGLVDRIVELGERYHVDLPMYKKISDWGHAQHIR